MRGQSAAPAAEADPRWGRVLARDRTADGRFFYSVATTGVYCRPSCPSRLANPRNVRFHATAKDCEAAGFRPCRRCRPDEAPPEVRAAAMMASACRRIDEAESLPSLADMAAAAGLSPHHFHRLFKAATGLTPRQYAAGRRAERVRDALARGAPVTEAVYDAGFNASSRFYETADAVLGMSPTLYRRGGAGERIRFAVGPCSLGAALVAATDKGVCAILLGDDPDALSRDLQKRFPAAELVAGEAGFEETVARVIALVEAPGIGLDLPLDIRGTAFQQRVWQALQAIPSGATASYAAIAQAIGAPAAARAVAGACAANALAVAIPCHRVVRGDGGLSGYRWGVARKRALLDRETTQTGRHPGAAEG